MGVDCLNMDPQWCKDFARYTFTQAEGSAQDKEDLEYKLSAEDYANMPTLQMSKGSFAEALERVKTSMKEKRFVWNAEITPRDALRRLRVSIDGKRFNWSKLVSPREGKRFVWSELVSERDAPVDAPHDTSTS